MTSTFTPNIQLEEPARGDDVGTWDTPVNANMTEIDLCVGGIATINAASGSVALSAAQLQSRMITVNSTLLASITLTLKTSFVKDYLVQHIATGSSQFTITLATTASGGQSIAVPPGETTHVYNDGTNIKFLNLGRVGSIWEYAGSAVPNWVSACTVPPYLNCDGTTFSAVTYPALASQIGTTLPDTRGRLRAALNQGTARMVTANGGVDGNTNFSGGGADSITLSAAQIPTITAAGTNTITVTVAGGHGVFTNGNVQNGGFSGGSGANIPFSNDGVFSNLTSISGSNSISVTSNNTAGQLHSNMQPSVVVGLTLIRAA